MFASALKKLSFAQNVRISRLDHIFLTRGLDATGEQAWYYIMIDHGKQHAFCAHQTTPYIKLTDYGRILFSGYGENPPQDIQDIMKEEYGFITN